MRLSRIYTLEILMSRTVKSPCRLDLQSEEVTAADSDSAWECPYGGIPQILNDLLSILEADNFEEFVTNVTIGGMSHLRGIVDSYDTRLQVLQ
jgi:hypothetical protein